MFNLSTEYPKQTNPIVDESLSLLQEFQAQLLESHSLSSQLALQEVQDCISDLRIEQQNPLSTSLNLSWLIREIETMLKNQLLTFSKLEAETWKMIKTLCHTN